MILEEKRRKRQTTAISRESRLLEPTRIPHPPLLIIDHWAISRVTRKSWILLSTLYTPAYLQKWQPLWPIVFGRPQVPAWRALPRIDIRKFGNVRVFFQRSLWRFGTQRQQHHKSHVLLSLEEVPWVKYSIFVEWYFIMGPITSDRLSKFDRSLLLPLICYNFCYQLLCID
jgi:hypothetical protein